MRWETLRDVRGRLKAHPYLGPASDEHEGCRVLVVSGYRLIYEVDPDTGDAATAGDVRVLAVFGPGQP